MQDTYSTRKLALATFAATLSAGGLGAVLLVNRPRPSADGVVGAICVAALIAAAGYWGLAAIEERLAQRDARIWQARLGMMLEAALQESEDAWQTPPHFGDVASGVGGFTAADFGRRDLGTAPSPVPSPRARRRPGYEQFAADLSEARDVWVWRNGRWQRRSQ